MREGEDGKKDGRTEGRREGRVAERGSVRGSAQGMGERETRVEQGHDKIHETSLFHEPNRPGTDTGSVALSERTASAGPGGQVDCL